MTSLDYRYDYPSELVDEAIRLFNEGDDIVRALAKGDQRGVYLLRQKETSIDVDVIASLIDEGKVDELYARSIRMCRVKRLEEALTRIHEEARPQRN